MNGRNYHSFQGSQDRVKGSVCASEVQQAQARVCDEAQAAVRRQGDHGDRHAVWGGARSQAGGAAVQEPGHMPETDQSF